MIPNMSRERELEREFSGEFDKRHDGEIADLSPASFRFAAALLIGLAVLVLAGTL